MKNKKILALFLTAALIMSMATTVFAEGLVFSDVAETDYFYNAVQWGVEEGITEGVGDNLFDPEGQVTRAQVVTFLWRMQGQPLPSFANTFDDVEAASWYEVPVRWAIESGVTVGTGDNKFSPDMVCDRAMCLTLLYRVLGGKTDEIDLQNPAQADDLSIEDMTIEEFGTLFVQDIYKSLREEDRIPDIPVGAYYELPVIWGLISGVITGDNSELTDENLIFRPTDPCVRKEMISFLYQTYLLGSPEGNDDSMIYYAGVLAVPIPQEYSEILAIDVDASVPDNEEGTLITVSELASQEAAKAKGEAYEGAGELFSVDKVSADTLHEMLCGDMSGMEVFGVDEAGFYYIFRTPTDVRFERETTDKMYEDAPIWTELNEWASEEAFNIYVQSDGLYYANFTNTELDMHLARIAYKGETNYNVSTTEFGPLAPDAVDAKYYAEALVTGGFDIVENGEAPDGEYVVLNFEDDDTRYDFFKADKNLVRETRGDYVTYYRYHQPENVTSTDTMLDWYEALAVADGKKEAETALDAFCGEWHEEIAGRGSMSISEILKTGTIAIIEVAWPDSASLTYYWSATAYISDDGTLEYNGGDLYGVAYNADGEGELVSEEHENSGSLEINSEGKLVWNYSIGGNKMSAVFVKNN